MNKSIHSEYGSLVSVLLKPVSSAFVSNEAIADQWKELNYLSQPDYTQALKEYEGFEKVFVNQQIELKYLTFDSRVTMDSIYCRDASIATDFGMILCEMGKGQRQVEPQQHEAFCQANKMKILGKISYPGSLEGGDVAWIDRNTLAVAHSYRSNLEGIRQLRSLLEPRGVEVVQVDLPHYKGPSDVFHLMSVLSPVDEKIAVVYSPLLPVGFRKLLLEKEYQLIEVPDQEFEKMACNVLALAPKKCLMLQGNPRTQQLLIEKGCEVILYDGAHISIMGGGGPTCLTRPLQRLAD